MTEGFSTPSAVRQADFFNFTLGGHNYRARLNAKGWSNAQIKEQQLALMEAHEPVVKFMGGQETVDMLPPGWREPMIALSALRMLVAQVEEEPMPPVHYGEDG